VGIVEDALHHGIKYEIEHENDYTWVEFDDDGFDEYLINTYGDSVGNLLISSFDSFDIEAYLMTRHGDN
jgi:hypothetical protein